MLKIKTPDTQVVVIAEKKLPITAKRQRDNEPARVLTLNAYEDIQIVVREFFGYTDLMGVSATSEAGFIRQLNKKIKAQLGFSVREAITSLELLTISSIRDGIVKAIRQGMEALQTRTSIKKACYATIHSQSAHYWSVLNV